MSAFRALDVLDLLDVDFEGMLAVIAFHDNWGSLNLEFRIFRDGVLA
jgi:hypothetical protein